MILSSLIYPMFAMVVLTFIVLMSLFKNRVKSVKEGTVDPSFFKTYQGQVEPDSSIKLSRHFANIFEAPSLFYIACLAGMITQITSVLFVALAWLYVLLRAAHAYIHIGENKVKLRINTYMSSWAVLMFMWIYLAVTTALG
jgi:hypothetical protein